MSDINKTIEIDGVEFPVYATVMEANAYMTGTYNNSDWFSVTTDSETKARLLITATRILDRQLWRGEPTGLSGQQLVWPRTGIEGVAEDDIPVEMEYACIELANLLLGGSDVETNRRPGVQTIQSLKAGSVALTYFRDAEGAFTQSARFPTTVQELIGKYLMGGAGSIGGAKGTGTDGESVTNQKFGYNEGL